MERRGALFLHLGRKDESVKLTRRGEGAFIALLTLALGLFLALVFHLSTHLHFTGEGYCYGSFIECYEGEGK
jgi:hypothetical protein